MRYKETYNRSINQPVEFWKEQSSKIKWFKEPQEILHRDGKFYEWFRDGELNSCYLALDYHIEQGRGETVALIYDSPVTNSIERFTYKEMLELVSGFAAELKALGLEKGDTAVIYMPMIPEAIISMLACARIGVVHSVVFGGFAPAELAIRIDDAKPKVIITANYGIEIGKRIPYLGLVENAIDIANHKVDKLVIKYRNNDRTETIKGALDMDILLATEKRTAPETMKGNDPLYILYTSGTTGAPKGILRDNGGHATALKYSMDAIYNTRAGEVFWAASDIGWVVGHSYIVYGPLFQGCTTVLYEGKPIKTPDAGAFWRVVQDHKVKTLFTAPTAIRAIEKTDPQAELMKKYDLSSLEALFLAGERCDPPTLKWISSHLNKPVIDHWWQTESGWPMVANPTGIEAHPVKPGSSGVPVCGYDIRVIDESGQELPANTEGNIVIKMPLPPGCLQTLWQDEKRYLESYLNQFDGYFISGDGGYIDEDGYVFIMGRIDDVINVAGHRLSTGVMEEVISAHESVAECAVFAIEDQLKGHVPCGLVVLNKEAAENEAELQKALIAEIRGKIGPIACLSEVKVAKRLPKTRSGKIVRKLLAAIRDGRTYRIPSTIENPEVVDEIKDLYSV
ncbi:MAG: AMP-binding protein [Bacteroidia bacterium]|nr:AMP-binding protein [Bacteroidia bacterium]